MLPSKSAAVSRLVCVPILPCRWMHTTFMSTASTRTKIRCHLLKLRAVRPMRTTHRKSLSTAKVTDRTSKPKFWRRRPLAPLSRSMRPCRKSVRASGRSENLSAHRRVRDVGFCRTLPLVKTDSSKPQLRNPRR